MQELVKARFRSLETPHCAPGDWNLIKAPFPEKSLTVILEYVHEVIFSSRSFRIDIREKVGLIPRWSCYTRILHGASWHIEYALSNGEWMGDYMESALRIAWANEIAGVEVTKGVKYKFNTDKFTKNRDKLAKLIYKNLIRAKVIKDDLIAIKDAKYRSA